MIIDHLCNCSGWKSKLADRGLKLVVSPGAKEVVAVAEKVYDPAYGARPLRRSIQRLIQDPLSLRLLAGEYLAGETVVVDKDGDSGKLTFGKEPAPELVEV